MVAGALLLLVPTATTANTFPPLPWPQHHNSAAHGGYTPYDTNMATAPAAADIVTLTVGGSVTGPIITDLDGDTRLDIVAASGFSNNPAGVVTIQAFRQTPTGPSAFWTATISAPSGISPATDATVYIAAGQMAGDANPEIAVYANFVRNGGAVTFSGSVLYVLNGNTGTVLGSILNDVLVIGTESAPVIGDTDGDGVGDVLVTHNIGGTAPQGFLLDAELTGAGLAVRWDYAMPLDPALGTSAAAGSPALAEFRGSHPGLEVVVAQDDDNTAGHFVVCEPGATFGNCSQSSQTSVGLREIAIGNIDADASLEAVAGGRMNNDLQTIDISSGIIGPSGTAPNPATYFWNTPAIADINNDGNGEVISVGYSDFVDDVDHAGDVFTHDHSGGAWSQIGTLARYTPGTNRQSSGGVSMVDLTGDGRPEAVFVSNDPQLVAVSTPATGNPTQLWSYALPTGVTVDSQVAVGDVNGDCKADLVFGMSNGNVLAVGATGAQLNPPSAVQTLTATPSGSPAQIVLSWSAPSSTGGAPVYEYWVYRSTTAGFTPGPANLIATVPAPTTTYTDTAVAAGTTYYYIVRAVNCTGPGANANAQATIPSTPLTCSGPSGTVALGSTQTFTAAGGAGGYTWGVAPASGASPSSGAGGTFNAQFTSGGTYTITLTSGGGTATCSLTVSSTPPALGVTITGAPTINVNAGTTITLNAPITGYQAPGPMVCSWTLSPATGASFNSPSQTTTNVLTTIPFLGTSVGSYSVVVTCDDDGAGPRTASATVTVVVVDPNAVVANVSGPATGTAGTAMTVQGVVSGGSNPAVITCTWSTVPAVPIAGNGCTSATFTPDRPGIFRVTVSATRGTGGNNNAVDYYDIVVEKANVPAVDTDRDGVADDQDNCPADANADQMDGDHNGRGDACDPQGVAPVSPVNPDGSPQAPSDVDTDLDGIADNQDNCPQVANANQDNLDHDEQGDACDPDDDGDQVVDTAANGLGDNCPRLYNPQQTDGDEDGTGDACDKSNGLGGSTGVSPGDAVATCPSCGDAATSSKELGSSRTGMLFVAGALAIAAVVVVAFALRRNR